MRSHFRIVLGSVIGVSIVMILLLGFHVGGPSLLPVGKYSQLIGCLIGGSMVLVSVRMPIRPEENVEPWLKHEQLAWTIIGCGFIPWFLAESLWRYYLAHGQSPFPSLADIGYSSLAPLIFTGLILQPFSRGGQKRIFLILDTLITTGALLTIAWFLLLGPLAQNPAQSPLAKFLGLYYPIADIALLSCIIFLLLRGSDGTYQVPARRIGLLMFSFGLGVYAISDFFFNVLQFMGLYVDGAWTNLGWPLGLMIMGVAAYLRRFLPSNARNTSEQHAEQHAKRFHFGPAQLVPYLLLFLLFLVLGSNVLSTDKTQQSIRPVLLIATLVVIGLVVVRQITTMQENEHLIQGQLDTFKKLEKVYQDVEKRKGELEEGVNHLKEIQTRLANGDVRARAQIMSGDLWPLATGLNLMADRMMRSEHNQKYAQKLIRAVGDLCVTLESRRNRLPVVIPASCLDVPELHRLLVIMGLRPPVGTPAPPTPLPPTTFQRRSSVPPGI